MRSESPVRKSGNPCQGNSAGVVSAPKLAIMLPMLDSATPAIHRPPTMWLAEIASWVRRLVSQPYLLALFAVFVATLVRMALDPLFGEKFPYITYLLATFVIVWSHGVGPSMVTLVLGFLSAFYFFASPRMSVMVSGLDAQVGAFSYIVTGVCTIALFASLRSAERRASAIAQELARHQAALEQEIGQRKMAQESVVNLLRKLVDAQEDERRRISRELHDQCGQDITALRLELKLLQGSLAEVGESPQQLQNLNGLVDRIAHEVHHLALKLRPPALDDLGLPAAITNYVDSWTELTGVRADWECRDVDESHVPPEIETALYRILQEALTNVAKHANAKTVSVVLLGRGNGLDLIVEDDGCGFATELFNGRQPNNHLGLMGMRERMLAIGGQLEIESTPDAGTTLYARATW